MPETTETVEAVDYKAKFEEMAKAVRRDLVRSIRRGNTHLARANEKLRTYGLPEFPEEYGYEGSVGVTFKLRTSNPNSSRGAHMLETRRDKIMAAVAKTLAELDDFPFEIVPQEAANVVNPGYFENTLLLPTE